MTNPVHFLVTPSREAAVSNTMKVAGSRYVQYINKKYRRTGTLWEGRHRASLVQMTGSLSSNHWQLES